jgi:hypothetical protein
MTKSCYDARDICVSGTGTLYRIYNNDKAQWSHVTLTELKRGSIKLQVTASVGGVGGSAGKGMT